MRKYFSVLATALFIASVFLTGCDKSNSTNSSVSQQPASGQWKVTYYFDKSDETSSFTGYTFEFKDGGILTASNGTQTWNGTWADDCDDSHNKFCITFNGSVPSALEEITEDWGVVEISSSLLHFEHASGGNGGTEIIHFEQ